MTNALWQTVLGEIELTVSRASFVTWFKNTELIEQTDNTVIIAVSNIFAKRQFEVKFNDQIRKILEKNGVVPESIIYTVKSSGLKKVTNREDSPRKMIDGPSIDELIPNSSKNSVETLYW